MYNFEVEVELENLGHINSKVNSFNLPTRTTCKDQDLSVYIDLTNVCLFNILRLISDNFY